MKTVTNTILAVALVTSTILPAGTFTASQAAAAGNSALYCQGYAQEAQRRYRDYQRKQCGNLVNTVWNPDYGTHYGYCMRNSQSTTEWLKALRYRVLLNNCAN